MIKVLLKWPQRSLDMTSCDFFLGGFIKDKVFVSQLPRDLVELRRWIKNEFAAVTRDKLIRVWTEMEYRLDICRVKKGAHIESLKVWTWEWLFPEESVCSPHIIDPPIGGRAVQGRKPMPGRLALPLSDSILFFQPHSSSTNPARPHLQTSSCLPIGRDLVTQRPLNTAVLAAPLQPELTLFDDNIHWVPVVRYLGLHIDSRLTFKKHIDYLSDKFWGRIATGISAKAGSSFVPPAVASKFLLADSFLFHSGCKKLKKNKKIAAFSFPLRFWCPRTRFGAVKPPFLRSSILALVTSLQFRPRSAALFLQPPPAGEWFQILVFLFILFSVILGISDLSRWHLLHLIFVSFPTSAGQAAVGNGSPSPRPVDRQPHLKAADLGAFACEEPNQQAQLTPNTNKASSLILLFSYLNYWQLLNFKFLYS
ncbi:uncharacterized protein TNCV_793321 [Trichonephila clavipes]|nr:uncharacterized protein TNCV_793321 [Trichonephila clavipes]